MLQKPEMATHASRGDMPDTKDITACFVDHGGLYLPLAVKLAESYKRVLYWDAGSECAFPKIGPAVVGEGYDNLERVRDFWRHGGQIDLFIFPDSQSKGLQFELKRQGFPVWGSFDGEDLEQSRELFHRTLGEVGLEVPKFVRITGLEELRHHLENETDKYIKISRYRGSLETFHWRSWDDDKGELDKWAVKFGGVANDIPFLVFDAIVTDLEIGADTYCIDGQFPSLMLDGTEWKDKAYFAHLKSRQDMPEQTKQVLLSFGPVLKDYGMRNFWSMEIRVKGDHFCFGDATPRGPIPGIHAQMELYSNLAEIIYSGAHGELVEPIPTAKFAIEVVLKQKPDKDAWRSVRVPPELKQWIKLGGCCLVDGRTWFPPDERCEEEIGWLVATGDTPRNALDELKKQVAILPEGVTAETASLVDILNEIESAEKEGIVMTTQTMPEPAEVVE